MICGWGNPVYAIVEFPDDDLSWRIERIGGVGYSTSVPSEPRIDVRLAQLPLGGRTTQREIALLSNEKNGQDRYLAATLHLNCFSVAEASPVVTHVATYRRCLRIDTPS